MIVPATAGPLRRNIFLGRQPIYDRRLDCFAYELLFRAGEVNQADVCDGNEATSQVILNLVDIGLNAIVGRKPAFLNLTRENLLRDDVTLLPPASYLRSSKTPPWTRS